MKNEFKKAWTSKHTALSHLGFTIFKFKNVFAQDYQFNFYNGDVVQSDSGVDQVRIKSETAKEDSPKIKVESRPEIKEESSEKLKRTGLGLLAGYQYQEFELSSYGGDITINSGVLGLSLISDYDFSLDISMSRDQIDSDLDGSNLTGNLFGLGLGIRHNYWLSERLGLSLGASLFGKKGEANLSNQGSGHIQIMTAGLNAGPVFDFGEIQLILAYEFNTSRVQFDHQDEFFSFDERPNSSGVKGTLVYRF